MPKMDAVELDNAGKLEVLNYFVREIDLAKTWSSFENAGLTPLLIKGWGVARCYDRPWSRGIGDFDIAFSTDEYSLAEAMVAEQGLRLVDLHRELRHLDTVDWNDVLTRSIKIPCHGVSIRIPCPEDHLRMVCVHWLNDGGANRARLLDIAWLIKSAGGNFDWDKCLAPVAEHRRRWIAIAIALAQRESGFSFGPFPFSDDEMRIPDWIEYAVGKEWTSGTRLLPLHSVLFEPKQLFRQIRKRIPPNPIQVAIEMEGDLAVKPSLRLTLQNIGSRTRPAARRVLGVLLKSGTEQK